MGCSEVNKTSEKQRQKKKSWSYTCDDFTFIMFCKHLAPLSSVQGGFSDLFD